MVSDSLQLKSPRILIKMGMKTNVALLLLFVLPLAWCLSAMRNPEWKCRIEKNMLSFLTFLHASINCEENRFDLEVLV